MFAVVDIAGQQFKVAENTKYYVPKLDAEPDSEITLDKVLAITDDTETKIGTPTVEGVTVTAKIIEHTRDEKILVFKKKRRKSYRKTQGHRQHLTRIVITKIG